MATRYASRLAVGLAVVVALSPAPSAAGEAPSHGPGTRITLTRPSDPFVAWLEGDTVAFLPGSPGGGRPENALLSYRFLDLSVGGRPVPLSATPASAASDGWLERRHGLLTERYDVRAGGLEQSFVLHRDPGGGGDLEIHGHLGGAVRAADSDPGPGKPLILHGRGDARIEIGRVLAWDAAGRETVGRLRVAGGVLSILLDGGWLAESAYPVVIDPLIAATFEINTNNAAVPAVTYDPLEDVYLVVHPRAPEAGSPPLSPSDIWVSAVHPTGTDPAGAPLALQRVTNGGSSLRGNPAIAFGTAARQALVVWEEEIGASTYIAAAAVAYSGAGLTIRWGPQVFFPLVGKQPDVQCLDRMIGPDQTSTCLLVFVGSDEAGPALVAVEMRLDTGEFLAGSIVAGGDPDAPRNPAVAVDPAANRYMVVWEAGNVFSPRILARVLNFNGSPQTNSCVVASTSPRPLVPTFNPDVAYDALSGRFLVAWNRGADAYGELVNPDCTTAVGDFPIVAGSEDVFDVTLGDATELGCFAAAMLEEVAGTTPYRIQVRTVSSGGAVGDPGTIDAAVTHLGRLAVGLNASFGEHLVLWGQIDNDVAGPFPDHFGQRYAASCGTTAGTVGNAVTMSLLAGELRIDWAPSCDPGDIDYAVYEGQLGDFYSHAPVLCSTSGSTSTVFPLPGGSRYYLIVATDGVVEGSYGHSAGLAGPGNERPGAGNLACRPRSIGDCP